MDPGEVSNPADPHDSFKAEVQGNIGRLGRDHELHDLSRAWIERASHGRYSYNFRWLGRPIIQFPQDIVALHELIFAVRPDVIVETGIAHGGSLVMSASMLALLDMCDAIEAGTTMDPRTSRRTVIGVDIDIRAHNREAIEAHPMASRISMIQGSSIDPDVVARVRKMVAGHRRVLVCLDSNHTHDHVLAELDAYAGLTSVGSYCVVFDTVVEDMPKDLFPDRPWGPGNNPKTAVHAWLRNHPEFRIDRQIQDKLQLTVAPDGYLRRISA